MYSVCQKKKKKRERAAVSQDFQAAFADVFSVFGTFQSRLTERSHYSTIFELYTALLLYSDVQPTMGNQEPLRLLLDL